MKEHIVLRLSNSQVALLAAMIRSYGETAAGNHSMPIDDTTVAEHYERWLHGRQSSNH